MADSKGEPIKKPTSFLTNSPFVAAQLRRRCIGRGGSCSRASGGAHAQCRGKTARLAAIYHFRLCRAILTGFRRQLNADGACRDGHVGAIGSIWEDEPTAYTGLYSLRCSDGYLLKLDVSGDEVFRDDLTGQPLDSKLVMQARMKELQYSMLQG